MLRPAVDALARGEASDRQRPGMAATTTSRHRSPRPDQLELDRALQQLGRGGTGVFTAADALAAGASPGDVATAVRSGRWTVLARGVYSLAPASADAWHLRVAAAQRRARGTVAVGRTAALLHGLPVLGPAPARPQLVRPRGPGVRRSDVPVVRLPDEHVAILEGVRVTTLARTAVDLARGGSPWQGVVALDGALWRLVAREELASVLGEAARSPGIVAARAALGRARAGAASPLETLGRLRAVDAGLPEPELQVALSDERGLIGVVDQLWREQGVVAEADGLAKYADRDALVAEKLREDRLRETGLEVVRYTWEDAWSSSTCVPDRVRRAFARAQARSRRVLPPAA